MDGHRICDYHLLESGQHKKTWCLHSTLRKLSLYLATPAVEQEDQCQANTSLHNIWLLTSPWGLAEEFKALGLDQDTVLRLYSAG